MSRDSSAMPDDNGTMCRGPAGAAVFSRGQRLALMCFLWKTRSVPEEALIRLHSFTSSSLPCFSLSLSLQIPTLNETEVWMTDSPLTPINPHQATGVPLVSLCSSALFLCLFGLVQWTLGLLRSVLVHAVALRWNRDRSLSSGKYFHHSFLFSCEIHGVIKSGKAWIPECHIHWSSNVWDDIEILPSSWK